MRCTGNDLSADSPSLSQLMRLEARDRLLGECSVLYFQPNTAASYNTGWKEPLFFMLWVVIAGVKGQNYVSI